MSDQDLERLVRVEEKLDLLLSRLRLDKDRNAYLRRRVPCSTPGCTHQTQTGNTQCVRCRQGRRPS